MSTCTTGTGTGTGTARCRYRHRSRYTRDVFGEAHPCALNSLQYSVNGCKPQLSSSFVARNRVGFILWPINPKVRAHCTEAVLLVDPLRRRESARSLVQMATARRWTPRKIVAARTVVVEPIHTARIAR